MHFFALESKLIMTIYIQRRYCENKKISTQEQKFYLDSETEQIIDDFYAKMKKTVHLYQWAVMLQATDRIKREYQGQQEPPKERHKTNLFHSSVMSLQWIMRRLTQVSFRSVAGKEMRSARELTEPVIIDVTPISKDDERSFEHE